MHYGDGLEWVLIIRTYLQSSVFLVHPKELTFHTGVQKSRYQSFELVSLQFPQKEGG